MEKHQSNTQQEKKTNSKVCLGCGEEKPLDDFYEHKNGKYGKQTRCKACDIERSSQAYLKEPERFILGNMKHRTKKQKYAEEVEWTKDEVKAKINGVCEITGIPFDNDRSKYSNKSKNPYSASPDRIDNTKGYTKDNTRWVVWIFNAMHSTFTEQQIKHFIEHLRNNEINL